MPCAPRSRTTSSSAVDGPVRPGYRFRHEILRALVASQLLPAEARRIHAAYAQALAEEPPRATKRHRDRQSLGCRGRDRPGPAPHIIEAGRAAVATFAFGQASDHYERALAALGPRRRMPRPWPRESQAAAAGRRRLGGRPGRRLRPRHRAHAPAHRATSTSLDPEAFELARSSLRWYLWESGDLEAAAGRGRGWSWPTTAEVPDRWRANALGHGPACRCTRSGPTEAKRARRRGA